MLRRRRPPERRPPDRRRTPPVENESDAEHSPLDDTLQSDIQLIRALQQIETLIEREKWPEVVAGLQQLLEGETGR